MLFFFVFLFSYPALANESLNGMIKSQETIEKSTRKENTVISKDVFSSLDNSKKEEIQFPTEKNCFIVKELVIEGGFLDRAWYDNIRKQATGYCLGVSGINILAKNLQDALIKKGYVTTRVEIPNQRLSSNRLVLNIAAGKIEKVSIQGAKISPWILPFKPDEILNLRDIEQGLEVLQKHPGSKVKVNIEPGSKEHYSNVVITAQTDKNWDARAWINNWGDKSTGKNLAGGAFYLYNLSGVNDIFYVSGSQNVGRPSGGYSSYSLWYSLPAGYWDFELFFSNSESRQQISSGPLNLTYKGESQYLSFKSSRNLYRDQSKKVSASAELTKRYVNYHLNDIELALQKRDMTNIRFGLNYKQNLTRAVVDSTLSYQRFLPILGADKTPDMKTGEASTASHLFYLDASYLKLLNVSWVNAWYSLKTGGQYSPARLTLQDQISLGNRWNVRGFENSQQLNGDKGFYVQNGISALTGIKNMEWYSAVDYGQIWGDVYPAGAFDDSKLLGATTGIKGSLGSLGYDTSVSKPLWYPNGLRVDDFILNFNISYQI